MSAAESCSCPWALSPVSPAGQCSAEGPSPAPAQPCSPVGMNPTGTEKTAAVPTTMSHGQQMPPFPGERGRLRTPILLISAPGSFLSRAGPLSVVGPHLCTHLSPLLCAVCPRLGWLHAPRGGSRRSCPAWTGSPSFIPQSPAPRQWGRGPRWALSSPRDQQSLHPGGHSSVRDPQAQGWLWQPHKTPNCCCGSSDSALEREETGAAAPLQGPARG